jgi:hypothetical protein
MVNGHRIGDDAYLRAFQKGLIEHCFHSDPEFYRKRRPRQITGPFGNGTFSTGCMTPDYNSAEVRFAWWYN